MVKNYIMSGDQYFDKGHKNLSGCFTFLVNHQKAFDNFVMAAKKYDEEGKYFKNLQAQKLACDIYDNNFDENKKQKNKKVYDEIIKKYDIILPTNKKETKNNAYSNCHNNNDDDEDTR